MQPPRTIKDDAVPPSLDNVREEISQDENLLTFLSGLFT
jgi:hypothetical protein